MSTAILSIDGGGMKGIVSAIVLIYLEEYLKEYSQDETAEIYKYFDLIAGTSTGSILTAILLCPGDNNRAKYSAKDALNLYVRRGKEMFERKPGYPINTCFGLYGSKYTNRNFAKALEDYFGTITIKELLRPCLMTTYDMQARKTVFINSASGRKQEERNYFLKDAVLASTAAPTYFPPIQTNGMDCLVDGGVFANNPALCALIEAIKLPQTKQLNDTLMLSIGNVSSPKTYPYEKVKHWGLVDWAVPMLSILMSSSEETVDYQLEKLYGDLGVPHQYLRIEGTTKENIPAMDDTSDVSIKRLEQMGTMIARDNDKLIRRFAKQLVDNRKNRL